jgi:glycolate dehydrogenase FAD-binding subunit
MGAMTLRTEITQTSLLTELQSLVGPDHAYAPGKDHHVDIDGLTPSAIVNPGSYEEVAAVLRYANREGLAVIPLGSGDFRWIGNIPRRYDIALSVPRLNAIVEYEPADLTITCQAGATLDQLNGPLGHNGQMLPFGKVPAGSRIGRLLALRGRRSTLAWGSARDFTIGLRIVTADGRIIRTGGKVVKNVAGYDFTKLVIGSIGTLGVIVEATFKLAPAPQTAEQIQLEFTSIAGACAFASELRRRGLSLWHVTLDRSMSTTEAGKAWPAGVSLTIDLAGTPAAVDRSRREVNGLAANTAAKLEVTQGPSREVQAPAWSTVGDPLMCQASVLPTDVPRLVEGVDEVAPGAFFEASPLDGSFSRTWLGAGADEQLVQRIRAVTHRLGGTLIVIGCDTELKRQIDVFGDPPPAFDLMRRVKQQLDPNGILSPGRFVGRL